VSVQFWSENFNGRDHLGIRVRIMLQWMLEKYGVGMWTGFSWLRIRSNGGHLAVYRQVSYEQLSSCKFLKEVSIIS